MLQAVGLTKSFGAELVLRGVELTAAAGTSLAILGRSGVGKSTLLKILAGLVTPDNGSVMMDDADLTRAKPEARGTVYLAQEALLFPHLDVLENVAFALRLRGAPDASARVRAMLAELGLEAHAHKRPDALSGGQRQRVAFGRALLASPRALLLDEPFGALDAETRSEMQDLYRRLMQEHRLAAVFVTHDAKEALTIGTSFGYLEAGQLHTYPSRAEFAADPRTGVAAEARFWRDLTAGR
jgi:ABC-type Fe3+/spermidine/putrescine transport system ATPase subunit